MATCSQLTKAEVQPLLADPITKVVVAPLTNERLTSSLTNGKKIEGQTCTYAVADTEQALTINVLAGSDASVMYDADLQGLSKPVSVPGIGDKAVRDGGDNTPLVSSLRGSLYCSVTPQSDLIPGLAALMHAAGDSADIGDRNYAIASAAVATLQPHLRQRQHHAGSERPGQGPHIHRWRPAHQHHLSVRRTVYVVTARTCARTPR